jgi:hypothetical protein
MMSLAESGSGGHIQPPLLTRVVGFEDDAERSRLSIRRAALEMAARPTGPVSFGKCAGGGRS